MYPYYFSEENLFSKIREYAFDRCGFTIGFQKRLEPDVYGFCTLAIDSTLSNKGGVDSIAIYQIIWPNSRLGAPWIGYQNPSRKDFFVHTFLDRAAFLVGISKEELISVLQQKFLWRFVPFIDGVRTTHDGNAMIWRPLWEGAEKVRVLDHLKSDHQQYPLLKTLATRLKTVAMDNHIVLQR